MVNLTIDGKAYEVPDGTTVLQAARMAEIHIPTLCDHPHLTPYGGCRLCLVEVDGFRTLQPSCTLPCSSNMVVRTDTPKIWEARKFVLTLIFSERNHFCMYCQKSNDNCDLQISAYGEGMTHWPLQTNWKPYPVDASHPFYVMDHNRCILCRKCVRACKELVGNSTLGMEERGFNTFLVADFGIPLGESSCVSCGTCVQVCPTGALYDKKSPYLGSEVQAEKTKSICLGCSVGCGIEVLTRDGHLVRIEGDWDAPVNAGVLCKTGRFEPQYEERERLVTPLVRKNGALKAATWEDALEVIAAHLKPLRGKNGAGSAAGSAAVSHAGVAALASSRLSVEALHLFKQVFGQGLQSPLVTTMDEGASTTLASAKAARLGKPFETGLESLAKADVVLAVGVDLGEDHQVAGFLVKRNLAQGTKLILVDAPGSALSVMAELNLTPAKGSEADVILSLAAEAASLGTGSTSPVAGTPGEKIRQAAQLLASAAAPVIVYGSGLPGKNPAAVLDALVELANLTDASLISFKGQANSLAAAQLGLEKSFAINGHQAVFMAIGDDTPSQRLVQKLEKAPFLVVAASYASAATARADVVLPVEAWAELDGHFVNLEGRVQSAHAALGKPEGVKTTVEALAAVASSLGFQPDGDWQTALSERIPPAAIRMN